MWMDTFMYAHALKCVHVRCVFACTGEGGCGHVCVCVCVCVCTSAHVKNSMIAINRWCNIFHRCCAVCRWSL